MAGYRQTTNKRQEGALKCKCGHTAGRNDNMPIEIMGETLYTMQETADKLGVTYRTISTYLRQGRITAQRIGGRWLFSEEAIRDFVLARTPNSKPPKND